jgi:hypothetical protein
MRCVIDHVGHDDSDVSSDTDVFGDEDKDLKNNEEAKNIDYQDDNDSVVSEEDETDDDCKTACDNDDHETACEDVDMDNNEDTIDNHNDMSESKKNNEEAPSEEEEDEHVVEEFKLVNDGLTFRCDDEEPYKDIIFTIWYLVESRGKLLMVRRQLQRPLEVTYFTRRVEVFEADMSTCKWVPVSAGLDGHALFISRRFSKSVSAGGEVEEDAIYFIDTGEVFNMRSKTIAPPNMLRGMAFLEKYNHVSYLFIPGTF